MDEQNQMHCDKGVSFILFIWLNTNAFSYTGTALAVTISNTDLILDCTQDSNNVAISMFSSYAIDPTTSLKSNIRESFFGVLTGRFAIKSAHSIATSLKSNICTSFLVELPGR